MVDWEATSEEEMRVQAVVLLLPAVDPAGGRSSPPPQQAEVGERWRCCCSLLPPNLNLRRDTQPWGILKRRGDTPRQGTGGWGSDRLREAGVEERRRWGGRSPEVRCRRLPLGSGEARRRWGWDWEFGMTDE